MSAGVLRAGSGRKRVAAPPPLPLPPPPGGAPTSTPLWLQLREHGAAPPASSWTRSFNHFQLQRQMDVFGAQHLYWWPPIHLRAAITEVLAAEGLVLALSQSGVCAAFDQESGALLCYLNLQADELILSLFVNPLGRALITVSTFSDGEYASQRLHVRSTPLRAIRQGQLSWRHLFDSELLCAPGFIEFDDVNMVIVTLSADTRLYKLWDMRALQQPRFSLSARGVRELKIASGGALLLVMEAEAEAEGEAGRPGVLALREMHVPLAHGSGGGGGGADMELVELFGRHLLTKEPGGPLRIEDLETGAVRVVPAAAFPRGPAAFVHLPFNHSFLAFWEGSDAELWGCEGQRLATLEGAPLPPSPNNIYIGESQQLMFLWAPPAGGGGAPAARGAAAEAGVSSEGQRGPASAAEQGEGAPLSGRSAPRRAPGADDGSAEAPAGCIRVFDLLRGRQVAAVQARPPALGGSSCSPEAGSHAAAAAAALRHATALFYDESTHRLYTGTADGRVWTWGL